MARQKTDTGQEPEPAATTGSGHVADDGDTRERILRAAEHLFAEHGFEAASMQEIASAAGVTKPLLYYYFADKRALYDAVLEDGRAADRAVFERTLTGDDPPEARLCRFIHEHCALLWSRQDIWKLFHREREANRGRCKNEPFKPPPHVELLERVMREGIESGAFHPMNPEFAVPSLFSILHSFGWLRRMRGGDLDLEDATRHVAAMFMRDAGAAPSDRTGPMEAERDRAEARLAALERFTGQLSLENSLLKEALQRAGVPLPLALQGRPATHE